MLAIIATTNVLQQRMWDLFCDKWEANGEESMITYLKNTYSGPWRHWKLYSAPAGMPVHNNGLEGINGGFKTNGTARERSDLGTFTKSVQDWIYSESVNTEDLPTEPNVTPSTWREAQILESGKNSRIDWAIKANAVLQASRVRFPELRDAWLMPSYLLMHNLSAPTATSKRKQLLGFAMQFVHVLADPKTATSFQMLLNTWKNFYILLPNKLSDTILYACSCVQYHRHLQCSHALALGVRQDGVPVPHDRSLQALGRKKRSRGGRYAKANSALLRQDEDDFLPDIDAGTAFACSQAADPCCFNCGGRKSTARNQIVFCDGCDIGYHQNCLVPHLRNIPTGIWFCKEECKHLHNRLETLLENSSE